ncbi:MAG: iduronate 2-sulfatase [Lentimonas sp.]|jgi:iduronate 2-sulfatase
MESLKELGLYENTIVIVWGDHVFHLGAHNFWGKHNTMDSSVRAPLIIRQPGNGVQRLGQIVEFVDVYPTLCALASLPIPKHCEGKSMKPIIDAPSKIHKQAVYSSFGSTYSVKNQNFLYSEWIAGGKSIERSPTRMLFDHKTDPQEKINVAELAEDNGEVERHHKLFLEIQKTWKTK